MFIKSLRMKVRDLKQTCWNKPERERWRLWTLDKFETDEQTELWELFILLVKDTTIAFFEGMESIIAWWRLQCRKDTGDAHATQDTSGPQTIVVRENHSSVLYALGHSQNKFSCNTIFIVGQYRTIIDVSLCWPNFWCHHLKQLFSK